MPSKSRCEQTLVINLPRTHELSQREMQVPTSHTESFRTRASIVLKGEFGRDYSTLREIGTGNVFALQVSIQAERAEEFRRRVAELGFSIAADQEVI